MTPESRRAVIEQERQRRMATTTPEERADGVKKLCEALEQWGKDNFPNAHLRDEE